MSFRRRSYPEVLENLLTTLTGGVAAEAQPFPPEGATSAPFRMPLVQAQPRDLVSVHGTRNGQSHRFRKDTDFVLDGTTLVWPADAELPDPGTVVHVNYYGAARPGPVTDVHTGSVVRTLAETVALEIAGMYAQMQAVYDAGFIDTAAGRSLDNVVALLGMERVRSGRATTQIEFTRAPGSRGVITIAAGTRIMDNAGEVEYETTEDATLPPEQTKVRVQARDLEPNDPVAAEALSVLPIPIAGIVHATNPAAAVIGTRDETDDELRTRARNFLHGSERATLGALRQTITRQGGGITADVVEDAVPGIVSITPHAETLPPALRQRLITAIDDVRPAGVKVEVASALAPQRVDLELRIVTLSSLLEQDLRAAHDAVRTKVADYFAKLPAREAGSINRLVGVALSVPGVEDMRIVSAQVAGADVLDRDQGVLSIAGVPTVLGDLRVADPNLATSLLALISHPEGVAPPDPASIRSALEGAIAYLNDVNASEPLDAGTPAGDADRARRVVSYGKLLLVAPIVPDTIAGDLAEHDASVEAGGAGLLLDEAGILPYRATFVCTQPTGLAVRLVQGTDSYTLTPFERLTLGGVEVTEDDDA